MPDSRRCCSLITPVERTVGVDRARGSWRLSLRIDDPLMEASETMFCTQCGIQNTEESNFCRKCGARLRTPRMSATDNLQETANLATDLSPPDDEKVSRLLDRAFQLYDEGALDQAFEVCRTALRLNPDSVTARSLLSNIYERQGQIDAAVRQMERVVEINPESTADIERLASLRTRQKLLADDTPQRPQRTGPSYRQLILNNPSVLAATGAIAIVLLAVVAFDMRGKAAEHPVSQPTAPATQTVPDAGAGANASSPDTGSSPFVNGSVFDGTVSSSTTRASAMAREATQEPTPASTSTPSVPDSRPASNTAPARTQTPAGASAQPAPAPARPSPAPPPRMSITRSSPPPTPPDNGANASANASTPSGKDYQQKAMEAQNRGDRAAAVDNFKRAIAAYRAEAGRSANSFEAQQGVRSCQLALKLLGESE